jgi:hypothetical protein
MIINFKMLGSFVEYRVVAEFDTALVIAVQVGRLVIQNSEFF